MLVMAMGLRGHGIQDHHHGMLTDLILAVLHHLVIVTLIVLLAVEFSLLRPGLSSADLRRAANVDAAYGAVAGLVIMVGICR
jgi:putative membrane protein